ncbi:hypothetical protein [Hyphomonas sp.]|uniref:hypothetical protein n=1 Tax=Hyphomonas sp. TaxID=87 RepID=UPI003919F9C0
MKTNAEGWILDDEGQIMVRPLAAYYAVPLGSDAVLVRLDQYLTDAHVVMQRPETAVQVMLTPNEAQKLGQRLIRAAQEARKKPPARP